MSSPPRANAQQIEYWNDNAGRKWVEFQKMLDRQLEIFGDLTAQTADVAPGQRVLDVGCGCGSTTLALARRVGAEGRADGVDISTVMLERARQSAREQGLENARFLCADAQTFEFDRDAYDAILSRFGVMFFEDPPVAFTNLASALRPGGRLVFACWQAVSENPWMLAPLLAALEHVQVELPADPHAPGPFAFADPERVRGIVTAAGFEQVRVEPLRAELTVGGGASLDDVVGFMLQLGPVGRVLQGADAATRERVVEAVRAALVPYETAEGVRTPSAAWIVSGRRPS